MNNDVNDPSQFFPFLIKRIYIRFTKTICVTIIHSKFWSSFPHLEPHLFWSYCYWSGLIQSSSSLKCTLPYRIGLWLLCLTTNVFWNYNSNVLQSSILQLPLIRIFYFSCPLNVPLFLKFFMQYGRSFKSLNKKINLSSFLENCLLITSHKALLSTFRLQSESTVFTPHLTVWLTAFSKMWENNFSCIIQFKLFLYYYPPPKYKGIDRPQFHKKKHDLLLKVQLLMTGRSAAFTFSYSKEKSFTNQYWNTLEKTNIYTRTSVLQNIF